MGWGGARNRPLESAEMIAKAADEGPVEIVKEDGGKRKGREEDEEPPAKKVRVERSYGKGGSDKYSGHEKERRSWEKDRYEGGSKQERRSSGVMGMRRDMHRK